MAPTDPTTLRDDDEPSAHAAALAPAFWLLCCPARELVGATLGVDAPLVIGRGSLLDDSRRLADERISTRHFEIVEVGAETVRIRDLAARNGCFVNGVRVQEATLSAQDVLRIGGTLLQLLPDVRTMASREPDDAVSQQLQGPSPALREVRARLRRIARLAVDVLVLGPPGAGKERVARALHEARAAGGPLVSLNCAVLTEDLAASELFGHVRGAFTGASEARAGAFRRADGGTLFLDEVADLPLRVQPKLLRALQEGRFQPLGSDREVEVRTQIVSATNRDLQAEVRCGRFRADLYSRLASAVITVPPLTERRSDIAWLAQHFLGPERTLHPLALEELLLHPWPHNVRDLIAVINLLRDETANPVPLGGPAREKMQADLGLLAPASTSISTAIATSSVPTAEPTVRWPERVDDRIRLLDALLRRHDGNVTQVARTLGKRATSVRRWLSTYGLDPGAHRDRS